MSIASRVRILLSNTADFGAGSRDECVLSSLTATEEVAQVLPEFLVPKRVDEEVETAVHLSSNPCKELDC